MRNLPTATAFRDPLAVADLVVLPETRPNVLHDDFAEIDKIVKSKTKKHSVLQLR
jgi:hypothetical protein